MNFKWRFSQKKKKYILPPFFQSYAIPVPTLGQIFNHVSLPNRYIPPKVYFLQTMQKLDTATSLEVANMQFSNLVLETIKYHTKPVKPK